MPLMIGKNSGGVLNVTSADGIGSTNLVLPESGTVIAADANGNVGLGVTPNAWASSAKAIDIGGKSGLSFYSSATDYTLLTHNMYVNSSGTNLYKQNGFASMFYQNDGKFTWATAPSGTAGNAITWANAMTLDASGRLFVGTTTAGSASQNGVSINNVSDSTYISTNHSNGTGSTAWYQNFSYNGIQIGSIYQSGTTAVVYATTSDYRLKENIRPADCKKFMSIKFVDYERIDGRHECGVIAHELQEVYPDLVTGEKDATEVRKVEISPAVEEVKDEDGNIITEAIEAVYEEKEFPVYQQVNYMGLIARIGTVVQQQQKLIDDLKSRIEVLEGGSK